MTESLCAVENPYISFPWQAVRLAQEVQQASMAIGQAAYQGEAAGSAGPGEPGNGTAADDEDIVEGEFESA